MGKVKYTEGKAYNEDRKEKQRRLAGARGTKDR